MIKKNQKVGEIEDVTIFEIREVHARTKKEGVLASIAISNGYDPVGIDASSDKLESVDLLIVGDRDSLKWLAELLLEQAELLPEYGMVTSNEEINLEGEKAPPNE